MDADDVAAADAWVRDRVSRPEDYPETVGAMTLAYLAGVNAERERTRPTYLGMADRIAKQSELLTQKAKRKEGVVRTWLRSIRGLEVVILVAIAWVGLSAWRVWWIATKAY